MMLLSCRMKRWKALVFILFFCMSLYDLIVVLASAIAVRGEQVPEDVPNADIQGLPEEPAVEGGVLSDLPEKQLESRLSTENLDTSPSIDYPSNYECMALVATYIAQILVDDALQLLSSLSPAYNPSESATMSAFLRVLWRTIDILKSMSFLRYSSQEEPLSYDDGKTKDYERAVQLLTKAGEMGNSEAMYLLGDLNFVPLNKEINGSMETTPNRIITHHSNGSRN
jgi:hypothetical protein